LSTEELSAILRAQDPHEWHPDVFPLVEELLRGRGVDVEAVKESTGAPVSRLEYGALAKVASLSDPLQANLCKMALLESGIEAWLSTEYLAGAFPPLGLTIGIDVLVRREARTAALELLARLDAGAAEIPSDPEQDPGSA